MMCSCDAPFTRSSWSASALPAVALSARSARREHLGGTASSAAGRQRRRSAMQTETQTQTEGAHVPKARRNPRGVFEKIPGSGVWWICYWDAQGRKRREKAGTKSAAIALYRKRKMEAFEGKKLPEKLRRATVSFAEVARDTMA